MRNDWYLSNLGSVCEIIMGQSPPSSTYNSVGHGLPFFQGKSEFTKTNPIPVKWCCEPKKEALPDDILISVRAPVGSTNIANVHCAIGRGLAAIRYPNCPKYIWYYLQLIENELDSQGTGTTFKAISGKILRTQKIPLAPLPEQRAIVAKIEELFSELDSGIDNLKAAKEKIEIYRQSVLMKAFEGELTKDWRAKQKTLGTADDLLDHIKEERLIQYEKSILEWEMMVADWEDNGKKGKKPSKPTKMKSFRSDLDFSSLYEVPSNWKWSINNDLLSYVTSGSRDWKKYYSNKGAYFIRTQDIKTNVLDLEGAAFVDLPVHVEGKRSLVEKGDLLMTITGANVGKVAILDFEIDEAYVSQSVALMKYVDKRMFKFLHYFFQAMTAGGGFINKLVYGVGRPVLSLDNMREVPVVLCSIEEQFQVVQEIESRLSVCDNISEAIKEALLKTEGLRQSILKKAFEGSLLTDNELEKCRKAPDWQPAEKLLDRIKSIISK